MVLLDFFTLWFLVHVASIYIYRYYLDVIAVDTDSKCDILEAPLRYAKENTIGNYTCECPKFLSVDGFTLEGCHGGTSCHDTSLLRGPNPKVCPVLQYAGISIDDETHILLQTNADFLDPLLILWAWLKLIQQLAMTLVLNPHLHRTLMIAISISIQQLSSYLSYLDKLTRQHLFFE